VSSRHLRPVRGWDVVARGRFETCLDGHLWTIDLDYFDLRERLHLYRDGVEVDVQRSPATFRIGAGATITAAVGLLGMKRVDVAAGGATTTLTPVNGTAEAWRLRFDRARPRLSRLVGALSWSVLALALVLDAGQLTGAVGLPGPANLGLGVASLSAALERALALKTSRWLG
jgi:hypothetical protein